MAPGDGSPSPGALSYFITILNHPFLHPVNVRNATLPAHLENLKAWLDRLPAQFGQSIPSPRGTLLCGIPGSGKASVAAVIARTLQRTMFRLDPACDAFAVAEIVRLLESSPPCVLFVEEPGQQHLGLIRRLLELDSRPVFLVAATVRPDKLPAGVFRRDLFDGVWHLDLPTLTERSKIWSELLDAHGPPVSGYDCVRLAQCSSRFTYGEIRAAHDSALRNSAGKVPSENDFLGAAVDARAGAHELDDHVSILRDWSLRHAARAGLVAKEEEFD